MSSNTNPHLRLLSVVVPARNEEGCIYSTVEHLHLELRLHGIPHEIVVVDDGSTDRTWQLLMEVGQRMPELRSMALSQRQPRKGRRGARRRGGR